MTIYVSYILETLAAVSFSPTVVAQGATAHATSTFPAGMTSARLIVEASWADEVVDGSGLTVQKPTEPCFVPNCENSEAYAEEHPDECNPEVCRFNPQLPANDPNCKDPCANLTAANPNCRPPEEPCPYNKNLAKDDSRCVPPPDYAQVCVDTNGDGMGDTYKVYEVGKPPAGAITTAVGDACTPLRLPPPPQIQQVQAVAEVLPVALPASGSGGNADSSQSGLNGLASLAIALIGLGSGAALLARRQ
jgi:hypothetical protein